MPETAANAPEISPGAAFEAQVEETIALCGGDVRAALRSALIANAFLAAQVECLFAAASAGFTRGRVPSPKKQSDKKAGKGDQSQNPESLSQPEAAPGARRK